MMELPAFSISEEIYDGGQSRVFRGLRKTDNRAVVLKMPRSDYPLPEELARFRREHQMTAQLRADGIVEVLGLEKHPGTLVMVLEDFGGDSLHNLLLRTSPATGNVASTMRLDAFLPLALRIAQTLGGVHRARIMHKDINPSNIVWNPATGQIKIIDFGISTQLSRESPCVHSPNVLEGTLAYMSPEQTGRMNRAIDYRTDFYSLGATFYQLLTGQTPFPGSDPMELVHSHIAKMPPSPHQLRAHIPPVLSSIVMKLMAKTAEDRYQSAAGLCADLQTCLEQFNATGTIGEFEIATQDRSDQLQIPQKLYGREHEINTLMAAFERVSKGRTEMMLVAGYSGIGKSSVVHEVHKPITEKRGFFIAGKFDQYKRNVPYSSLIQAFQGLVRQLLTEDESRIALWRSKLSLVLGNNAQVMIAIIPELKLILGDQPSVTMLPAAESQNRFHLVFQNFVQTFASKQHPLVLFLDDLQWADPPSLKLLELLTTTQGESYILILGAYRDNEVNAAHPVTAMLADIRRAGAMVDILTLPPLEPRHADTLVSETLHCSPLQARELAQLCFEKTAGNPFFLNQFLHTLYEENLINFDFETSRWAWSIEQIKTRGMTDNVVELMVAKVQRLPQTTQELLKVAACVGNQFDLRTLAIAYRQSPTQTATDLWEGLQAGLLYPIDESYKFLQEGDDGARVQYRFLHDRVQQAAYVLIPDAQVAALHLGIGRLLLERLPAEELEDRLFDVLQQLNAGRGLVSDAAEKLRLIELNLRAGKKARNAGAYRAAAVHLGIAMDLLPEGCWDHTYALTLDIYRSAAEAHYLSGDFEQADALYPIAVGQAQTVLDKISIFAIQTEQYQLHGRLEEAITVHMEGLRLLGFDIPDTPEGLQALLMRELAEVSEHLAGRTIEELVDAPPMTLPEHHATMALLVRLFSASYLCGQVAVNALATVKMVNLSLKHGNDEASSLGYVVYGFIQEHLFSDYATGRRYGLLGLGLSNRSENLFMRCKAQHVYACLVHHWTQPIRSAAEYYQRIYSWGLEVGDLLTCGFVIAHTGAEGLICGKYLPDLLQEVERGLAFLHGNKHYDMIDCTLVGGAQPIRALMGLTRHPFEFDDAQFSTADFLRSNANASLNLGYFYLSRIRNAYLFEDRENWLALADQLPLVENAIVGQCKVPEAAFYTALILLAHYPTAAEADQAPLWQRIEKILAQMRLWASNSAENYLHKQLLIEAEMARIQKDLVGAMRLYQLAITQAQANDYTNMAALGNELYAKFWLEQRQLAFARLQMWEAHHLYGVWGAQAKVTQLEQTYPALLSEAERTVSKPNRTRGGTMATTAGTQQLDLSSVLKASQTLSGEILLPSLLEKLLSIILENAGAQRGLLMLAHEGKLRIEAEGRADRATIQVSQGTALDVLEQVLPRPLPLSVVRLVEKTGEALVLDDAGHDPRFEGDPYVRDVRPRSILCSPIVHHGRLTGVLYLENNLLSGAFTPERLEVLRLIAGQAAISIENASLYANLEIKVTQRTRELSAALAQLEQQHQQLKAAQAQLIHAEKMASLGQLVANVAHEINTPFTAVKSSGQTIADALDDALTALPSLMAKLDQPTRALFDRLVGHYKDQGASRSTREMRSVVRDLTEKLEAAGINDARSKADMLVVLRADAAYADYLPLLRHPNSDLIQTTAQSIGAIITGTATIGTAVDRVSKIVSTLRSFTRADSAGGMLASNLQQGIETVLSVYQSQIKQNTELVCEFETLPPVLGQPGELNQLWTHLIHNALQAMAYKGKLTITLRRVGMEAVVSITDTGSGIADRIRDRIFEPFFTTRPTGEGAGLGLDIVRKVVDRHNGRIEVHSTVGVGSTFVVYLPLLLADEDTVTQPTQPQYERIDHVVFVPETPGAATDSLASEALPWKVLVVDDEAHTHAVTRLAVGNLTFQGRPLQFFNALSGAAAREILAHEKDIALALIDVVMETEHSGLNLVRHIRDELGNKTIRLVLRTGQPGRSSEDNVMANYEIDDYKLKTELTVTQLTTVIISNLRTYAKSVAETAAA